MRVRLIVDTIKIVMVLRIAKYRTFIWHSSNFALSIVKIIYGEKLWRKAAKQN